MNSRKHTSTHSKPSTRKASSKYLSRETGHTCVNPCNGATSASRSSMVTRSSVRTCQNSMPPNSVSGKSGSSSRSGCTRNTRHSGNASNGSGATRGRRDKTAAGPSLSISKNCSRRAGSSKKGSIVPSDDEHEDLIKIKGGYILPYAAHSSARNRSSSRDREEDPIGSSGDEKDERIKINGGYLLPYAAHSSSRSDSSSMESEESLIVDAGNGELVKLKGGYILPVGANSISDAKSAYLREKRQAGSKVGNTVKGARVSNVDSGHLQSFASNSVSKNVPGRGKRTVRSKKSAASLRDRHSGVRNGRDQRANNY